MSTLTEQAAILLDYSKFNQFFSYDLLGYVFMALATFLIAFAVEIKNKADKWLKALLMICGIFAISCVVMPMLRMFKTGMAGGDIIGKLVLEFWCFTLCRFAYCLTDISNIRNELSM